MKKEENTDTMALNKKQQRQAAKLLKKLKKQAYQGTEAAQMISSIEDQMIDLLKNSKNFDPKKFTKRSKASFLTRTEPTEK